MAPVKSHARTVRVTVKIRAKPIAAPLFWLMAYRGSARRRRYLFADDPPVADRIGRLYDQILADEVEHVGFIAAKLFAAMARLHAVAGAGDRMA